ncbi:glycoside hydrolase family 43 protein [Aplosporella prunicola CBS 121167]|uniref:Glycoside hydrolase family 43 protein n=1 Tax=Aplosporella prunicola CBS 121167 TaxID=1176127 RepID=A0A6A6B868_9PEZI|nr:glycoside hydrolase family 43 protein [Aplosporella prunicola CBS 121167]KAF2140412.1 glycoside hydrolase family 43 protein [Aplosporella prunicola CBS 121167]
MPLDPPANPILPGPHPDPSITRAGSSFFLATSSFALFPGIPIHHSTDLATWTLIGHALTRPSQLMLKTPEPGGGVWAPTLRYREEVQPDGETKGVWWLTACVWDRYSPQSGERVWPRGFVVKTEDIWDEKKWSEPVYFDQVGFDQDLFWDKHHQPHLSTTFRPALSPFPAAPPAKDFAVHTAPVDLGSGRALAKPRLLRASGTGMRVAEGAHLFARGRWTYLLTAEGGTEEGHCVVLHRSGNGVDGPWEAAPAAAGAGVPGVVFGAAGEGDAVTCVGHADVVEDAQGDWWAVCLGVRRKVFGRETFLVEVQWGEDGWPVFNRGRKIGVNEDTAPRARAWKDGFESAELGRGWYRKNTPLKPEHSLSACPHHLRLHGNPYTLASPASPTLFLRKQTTVNTTWRTRLSFRPALPAEEAGTTAYWDYFTHARVGLRLVDGIRTVRFWPPEGAGHAVDAPLSGDGDMGLAIECGEEAYRFGFWEEEEGGPGGMYSGDGEEDVRKEVRWLGAVPCAVLTRDPPVGLPFLGVMLGLYAFGEGMPCLADADFAYARVD